MTSALRQVRAPRDLNYLSEEELVGLCSEMRQVDGGLGAGVCELAVALHRIFDFPPDRLAIGDASLVRACALVHASHGQPDPDAIGTALGWAWARDLKGQKHHVVAIDSHPTDRRLTGREGHPLIVVKMHTLTAQRPAPPRSLLPTPDFLARRRRQSEPVDARHVGQLLSVLDEARDKGRFQVLEVLVEPSRRRQEPDPVALSGPIPTYQEVLAHRLFELARADRHFVWIGPHPGALGREYPERYVEWEGVAEHTLAVAASLGADGIPVVALVRGSELPRCIPMIVERLSKCPVTLVVDQDDDPLEMAALRALPGVPILAPADENDLRVMITAAIGQRDLVAICCPRGQAVGVPLLELSASESTAAAERLSNGVDVAILASGRAVYPALLATRKLSGYRVQASVVNMRCLRPLDENLLMQLVDEGIRYFLTVEESNLLSGLGGAVMHALHRRGLKGLEVRSLGREDKPLANGLLGPHDPDAIVAGVLSFVPTPG